MNDDLVKKTFGISAKELLKPVKGLPPNPNGFESAGPEEFKHFKLLVDKLSTIDLYNIYKLLNPDSNLVEGPEDDYMRDTWISTMSEYDREDFYRAYNKIVKLK